MRTSRTGNFAGMVESADTTDSKSVTRKGVRVQVPLSALATKGGVVMQGTEEIFNFDDYWNEWEFTEDEDLLAKKHAENIAYERSLIPEDARHIADFPKKSNFGKRALRRKRTSHYKNRLARKVNFASVGYQRTKERKWADEGDEVAYVERKWRGQRSKHIKRTCNRLFRHSARLRMLVTGCKGILHKTTEFWWEYD